MEPIISPWWFYLVGVMGYVQAVLIIGAVILGFLAVIAILDCYNEESDKKFYLRVGFAALAMLLLAAFIPDRQTAYNMLAASVITPDNIQAVQGNVADFIMNIAKSMQEVKQ